MIIVRKSEDGAMTVSGQGGVNMDPDTVLRPVVVAGRHYHFKLILRLLEADNPEYGFALDFSGSTCEVANGDDFWAQVWYQVAGESLPYDIVAGNPILGFDSDWLSINDNVPRFAVVEGYIRPSVGGELRPTYGRAGGSESPAPIFIAVGSMMIVEECKGQD